MENCMQTVSGYVLLLIYINLCLGFREVLCAILETLETLVLEHLMVLYLLQYCLLLLLNESV